MKAGVGREIISPPLGTILLGYAPGRPAESIHDDLRVTCVALESGQTQAMLISADICMFSAETVACLRKRIQEETGIPAEHIVLSATHTHSGPVTSATVGWGNLDKAYVQDILEPQTIKAAKTAYVKMQTAVLGIGTTLSDIGINRRQLNRNGTISLGQNPWGPYDPVLTVLSVMTPDKEPIVNLIHYCCHGTASGMNPEVTRDWSGPMVDCLEEQSGALSVFFNGAEGDIGPRLPNGKTTATLKMAQALGAKAGIDAVRAWRSIKEYRDVAIQTIVRDITLPYRPLPDLATAQSELASLGDPDKLFGMDLKKYDKWQQVIRTLSTGIPVKSGHCFSQILVAVGPVAFVPFPYEMFVEMTLRIREHSPFQHTLCLSETNGSFGYFPTKDQYSRGGYEITMSHYFDAYVLTEDADDFAVEENLKMLEELIKEGDTA
jgi:hypothetical protein